MEKPKVSINKIIAGIEKAITDYTKGIELAGNAFNKYERQLKPKDVALMAGASKPGMETAVIILTVLSHVLDNQKIIMKELDKQRKAKDNE